MTENISKRRHIGGKAPYDYLVVGSGLYGATFARLAKDAGKRVLVIEKRGAAGGNVRCEKIAGINVHAYGAHIFHTSDRRVWDFVNSFCEFNRYTNSPVANCDGRLFNLPFNMNTFYELWGTRTPAEAMARIEEQRRAAGISEPKNLEEQALFLGGADIYETLVRRYTEKQWGRPCRELPASILRRLPFRFTFDNNYFDDSFQGIPVGGYNVLIEGLLDGIEVRTDTDFFSGRNYFAPLAEKIVYTGKIDEFFGYEFGRLEWRSVRFETEVLNEQNFQGVAVMNYTGGEPFTRIIEHKHFERENAAAFNSPKTVISKEFSAEWKDGAEPFYPIGDGKNSALYEKYAERAAKESGVIFGGRLAEYKYYDMDDVIEKAFARWEFEERRAAEVRGRRFQRAET